MECAKCGKPYMIGLVFRYTKEGFLCMTNRYELEAREEWKKGRKIRGHGDTKSDVT